MKCLFEIGAFDGHDSLIYHSRGFEVFTFEPKKDLFNNLVKKTKNLKNYNVYPFAVCLTDGNVKFNICKQGGASSILDFKPNTELNKHWTNREDIYYSGESYDVPATRLDTFIKNNKLENRIIDFIHIDAQGVDLEVLESLGVYIKNVQAGVVETVKNVEKSIYLNQNNNILSNVETFLELNGFKVNRVEHNDPTNCEFNVHFSRV